MTDTDGHGSKMCPESHAWPRPGSKNATDTARTPTDTATKPLFSLEAYSNSHGHGDGHGSKTFPESHGWPKPGTRTRRTWHGHGRTRPQWFKSLIASSRAAPWEAMLLVKEAKQEQLEPGVENILPAHPSPLPPACPEWRDSCNSKVQIRPNCNYYLGQPVV